MENYDDDIKEQILLDLQRFEEDKLNECKVISIAYQDKEVKAIIIEEA